MAIVSIQNYFLVNKISKHYYLSIIKERENE